MSINQDEIDFTGERIIPEMHSYFFFEHLARYRLVRNYVHSDTKLLDVGCGDGYGTYYLSQSVKSAVGIDISKEAIAFAEKKYKKMNLQFKVIEPAQWIFADNEYDCVTFFEVIEHIEQPEKLLEQIKLSMKDNAVIIISTPNREVFGDNIKNPFHCKEYSLQEFVDMIGKFFCIREVLGQRYKNPWIKKWNFMVSKYAMEFPLLLKIYSRHLSRKPKKYLEAGYFDKLELKNNYFSKETPENADYFILVCGKYGGIETTGRQG